MVLREVNARVVFEEAGCHPRDFNLTGIDGVD
jgi:hypothetical protein